MEKINGKDNEKTIIWQNQRIVNFNIARNAYSYNLKFYATHKSFDERDYNF